MANRLETAATRLAGRLKTHAGQAVVYARGATTANLTATPGRSEMETHDTDGTAIGWESRDWIIPAADLAAAGLAPPARGDTITATIADEARVFTVTAPDGGRPFTEMDPAGVLLRIHTTE